jgi:ParB/RepB/Spo0J family partition protein
MNAPEAAVHTTPYAQSIPLAFIAPSPTNPRKHFDKDALADLTESVRKHGIIQPVLVRSGSSKSNPRVLWELVAGERRYRAATAAGLEESPCIVRTLTDVEALELQVIENLQRADLHALEEAEGYEQLMKLHAYTADDIAAKVGKSKAYVYARLKLCALCGDAREAFYAGDLNPSTALLVARIPTEKVQKAALKELVAKDHRGEVMPVRMAAEHIQKSYMLRLKEAPFSPNDEKLAPKAGGCAACPKRTGNQPELFGDVKSGDVCTDPQCFAAKKDAHYARIRAEAEAKGAKVISGKDAKAIKQFHYASLGLGWIAADHHIYEDDKQRTAKQILGKAHVWTLLEDPFTRELVPIIQKATVLAALGIKATKPVKATSGKASTTKRSQDEIDAELYDDEISQALVAAIRAAPPATFSQEDFIEIAILAGQDSALGASDFGYGGGYDQVKLRQWMRTLSSHELATMMLCFTLFSYDAEEGLVGALQRRGIDRDAIVKEVIAAEKAKEAAKPAAPAKKVKAK